MRRIVSIVLSLSLIISFSIPAYAQESTNPEEEITRIREEVELREPNADTYLLSDGSYECVVYSDNKYFENDNGKLIEIDNSIVNEELTVGGESYAYANKANSTKVYFSDSKPAIYLDSIGKNLSFEMIDTLNTNAVVGGDKTAAPISDFKLSGDNYILYPEIEHQTDLVYEVRNGLLKEYIIIKESGAPTEYSFRFNSNYRLEKTEGGVVIVYDNKGEAVFELGRLFAVDAADNYTEDLEYTITEESGECIVTVSVSPDYLNDPDRAFPVLIDPSIPITGELETFDSYVSSRYPSNNYYLDTFLRTGRDSDFYKRRSYIKFNLPEYIDEDNVDKVTSVFVKIRKYSGSTPAVKAYRVTANWSSSGINWNNKPGNASQGFSFSHESNNWYKANITTIAKKWFNGDAHNYGLVLKDESETGTSQWTTFYSSDAASPNKPELHIYYKVNHQYLSFGYGSSTIDIHTYSFNDETWQNAINRSFNRWNNSDAPVTFTKTSTSNNYIYVGEYTFDAYAKTYFDEYSGTTLNKFHIKLNKRRIKEDAENLNKFIQSVLVHEMGHTIWLDDNPITNNASIMKYSRDRDTMVNPSSYDVGNVDAKY